MFTVGRYISGKHGRLTGPMPGLSKEVLGLSKEVLQWGCLGHPWCIV